MNKKSHKSGRKRKAVAAPFYLIVGQSHTDAVEKALGSAPDPAVAIVNFNRPFDPRFKKSRFDPDMVKGFSPTHLILMASGNYHNVIGLVENPIRFNVMDPKDRICDADPERVNIPYALLYEFFSSNMRSGFLRTMLEIRDCFQIPTYHISSPPPHPDSQFIADNPGHYFSDKVSKGVAPPALRRKLYDMHTRVYREFCQENDIVFVPPPAEAIDKNGFLRRPFWRLDPTHANEKYGRLVLDQIRCLPGKKL